MTNTDTSELVDLDELEPDEELVGEMRKARVTTPLTRVLLGVVVVAAAFLAGAYVHRWQHPASASSGVDAEDLIARFRDAAGGGGGTGGTTPGGNTQRGGLGGSGATIGTVKLVDGSTVYVEDTTGNVTRVTTDGSTTVTLSKDAKVSELAPGTSVIVQGEQDADGAAVAATSISESAGLGAAGFGGGGLPSLPANGTGG